MRTNIKWILFIASIFALTSCFDKQSKEEVSTADFSKYISGHTPNVISNRSNIRVVLTDTLSEQKIASINTENLFKFYPDIKGETKIYNQQEVVFTPKTPLPSNTSYKCKFYLDKVVEVEKDKKEFIFQFNTRKQDFSLFNKGFFPYQLNDNTYQRFQGELQSADYIDEVTLNKIFSAKQGDQKLSVNWNHTADGEHHYFTIDSIKRTEKGSQLDIQVLNHTKKDEKIEQGIYIPAKDEFDIIEIKTIDSEEQYVSILCSDPVNDKKDLRGLIRFKEHIGVKIATYGNEIKVFPKKTLKGKYKLIIEKGLSSLSNIPLGKKYTHSIYFKEVADPEVEFLAEGNIMPHTSTTHIPFKAISLKGIKVRIIRIFKDNVPQFFQMNKIDGTNELKRVGRIVFEGNVPLDASKDLSEWNIFSLDLTKFIKEEPGAIYNVQINFTRDQALLPCNKDEEAETENAKLPIFQKNKNDEDLHSWRGFNTYDYTNYNWDERYDPCKESYYIGDRHEKEINVISTNVGVVVKKGSNDKLQVFTQNITNAQPMAQVEVKALNFQNRVIGKGITNGKGLTEITVKGKPYMLIAQKDNEYTYVRLDDASSLPLTMFETGGEIAEYGISGFLYAERSVWRPGDSIFMNLMIKDAENVIPKDHPITFELIDPKGNIIDKSVTHHIPSGILSFKTATKPDAFTGNWHVKAKLGGVEFSKKVRIETIKPNRLKFNLKIKDGEEVITNTSEIEGDLTVKYLHGGAVSNLKTEIEMTAISSKTVFKKYPDYTFDDPTKYFDNFSSFVFKGKLNNKGQAYFSEIFDGLYGAAGMVTLKFSMRTFETSGDINKGYKYVKYSPYNNYVGVKLLQKAGESYNSEEANNFSVVSLDCYGNPTTAKRVKVEAYKINWSWWWEYRNYTEKFKYISSEDYENVFNKDIEVKNGKGDFTLKLDHRYYGRLFIRVTDLDSRHSSGGIIMMDYPGWWGDENIQTSDVNILSLSTDKNVYEPKESAKITFPSSKGSTAIVTVENNSTVLFKKRVETKDQKTSFSLDVTEEMAPNAYVCVHYIQPYDQEDENDRPLRLFGITPLYVTYNKNKLHPEIITSPEWEPEKEVSITVSEENNREMYYTVAIVDEGLLDLTSFKTPKPWNFFNRKKALGVRTWDMYNEVLNAFEGNFVGLLKPGGGAFKDAPVEKKNANRFKPVVKYFGPFHLQNGKKQKHTFKMPNYVGAVRAMVVARDKNAFGYAEKSIPVKKPLMVLATAPRVLRPGEVADIPVTVFSMQSNIKNVTVNLDVNEVLEIIGDKTQKTTFTSEGNQIVTFKVRAKHAFTAAEIKVSASSLKYAAKDQIELNILPYSSKQTQVKSYVIQGKKLTKIDYQPFGVDGSQETTIEISSLISINLKEKLAYLITYPHGCAEQTVSRALPQLYLENLLKLSVGEKKEIEKHIHAAIEKLPKFQGNSGGFKLWPNDYARVSHWVSNYVGQFMVEAQNKGYYIPNDMYIKWLSYQQREAKQWNKDYYEDKSSHQLVQAYRLYTLALAGEPAYGDMNRLKEEKPEYMAAQYLALAYLISDNKEAAASLITSEQKINTYETPGSTFGNPLRDLSIALQVQAVMGNDKAALSIAEDMMKVVNNRRYMTTQTTAFVIMGLAKYAGNTSVEPINIDVKMNDKALQNFSTTSAFIAVQPDVVKYPSGSLTIDNKGNNNLTVKVISSGIPTIDDLKEEMRDLQIKTIYSDINGNEIDPTTVKQHTDIVIDTYVKHPGNRLAYENLALTQIIPSGWEIRNLRLEDRKQNVSKYIYQDIRDDRVYTYFNLNKGETKHFQTIVNAAYAGEFFLPGTACEAMYQPEISATLKGKWIEVVK